MAATLNLPFTRFVAQVSTGEIRPKVNYLSMMAENLEALMACDWREAAESVVAEIPPHDFTKASYISDSYDAFKMTGAYDPAAMTEIGFAGMAAYRFKLPDDYLSGSQTLVSMALPISRDRYLKGGLRVALALSDSALPSKDWAVVRGESGQAALLSAQMSQSNVQYLVQSSAASDTPTADLSGSDATKATYLWAYITLEDYEDRWISYNAKEARNYAIEGVAMLSGDLATVTFSADVTPDDPTRTFAVMRGGVAPLLPEGSASGARVIQLQRTGDALVPSWSDRAPDATRTRVYAGTSLVYEISGTVSDVMFSRPFEWNGNTTRLVAIAGTFGDDTFGAPGILLFDAATGTRITGAALTFDSDLLAALQSPTGLVGCIIVMDSTTPHAYLFYADFVPSTGVLTVTKGKFLDINLSTLAATVGGTVSTSAETVGDYPIGFYDIGQATFTLNGVQVEMPRLLWFGSDGTSHTSTAWADYSVRCCPTAIWTASGGPIARSVLLAFDGTVTAAEVSREIGGDGLELVISGNVSMYAAGPQGAAIACDSEIIVLAGAQNSSPSGDIALSGASRQIHVGALNTRAGLRAIESAYGSDVYTVTGDFTTVDGDASLRHGFTFDAATGERTALGYGATPYGAASGAAVVPALGEGMVDYYLAADLAATPSAAESAIGLRTLQAAFYQGRSQAVARATRDRLGAAFSIRAGTATLNVVSDGVVAATSVPVWRLFASALVIPFAVPTTWRGRSVRLDWTDWTGSATAGGVFNVWILAGSYESACPDVLSSDIPYNALAAEMSGWQLLGTIDATLAGASRTVTLPAPQLVGIKFATLMFTAFISADNINPASDTVWPIGVATEVDCEGTADTIDNVEKAWMPSITLV